MGLMHWDVIPGSRFRDAGAALEAMLEDATVMRIAVAFVSETGIASLATLLERVGRPRTVEVVTRATHTAPGTTAEHLRSIETTLGAETRAFVGAAARAFHPKTFLVRTPLANLTLSGSGNLTLGGLSTNAEQFELLRTRSGPTRIGERQPERYEPVAAGDLTARWASWWGAAPPLAAALAHPAFLHWEAQSAHREALETERRALEAEVEARQPGEEAIAPDGLNTSRMATEQKVRGRMEKWFPEPRTRGRVYELMADTMRLCHDLNPHGWWCGYVTDGGQHDMRLTVCARNAQVLVIQEAGKVYFNAPPAAENQSAFDLCLRLADLPGVRVTPSVKDGSWSQPLVHPYAEVPAAALTAALDAGAARLLDAAARWRMVDGRAPHWGVHSPALVRAVARETGRTIPQPAFEV